MTSDEEFGVGKADFGHGCASTELTSAALARVTAERDEALVRAADLEQVRTELAGARELGESLAGVIEITERERNIAHELLRAARKTRDTALAELASSRTELEQLRVEREQLSAALEREKDRNPLRTSRQARRTTNQTGVDMDNKNNKNWVKSSRCGNATCVEVSQDAGWYLIRDSKNPDQGPLRFTSQEWAAFTAGVVAGEFRFGGKSDG